jgi:hypothetical protein
MNTKSFVRVGAACVGTFAGLSVAVGPAMARTVPASAGNGYRAAHSAALRSGLRPVSTTFPTSAYLGGYDVSETGGSISVTSTVQVPKAKCANLKDDEDIFLGEQLDPAAGNAYQGGSNDAAADVIVLCDGSSATPSYMPEAYTTNGGDDFGDQFSSPGDLVQFTLTDSYGGNTTATATDLNTGQSETSTGTSLGTDTQLYLGAIANVGEEQFGSTVDYDVPKFTTAKFDNALVNGTPWSTSDPQAFSLQQNSDVQIKPSAVPAKASYNFTLTESHTH